ncbi:uncharacterized protein OCT59_001351 [Rhizophagus irregularis]|uniref:uncharacterized protein n=1 Tax=Rhizophagus irregularis TaxID=588596 RepID=UPI00331E05D2|nr:hypothetical protein OCT59_001351 [Rhizophagus irregularis]
MIRSVANCRLKELEKTHDKGTLLASMEIYRFKNQNVDEFVVGFAAAAVVSARFVTAIKAKSDDALLSNGSIAKQTTKAAIGLYITGTGTSTVGINTINGHKRDI